VGFPCKALSHCAWN